MRLDHVTMRAENIDAMRDFLMDLLGVYVGPRPDFPFAGYWLYRNNAVCLHIRDNEGVRKDLVNSGPIDHFCFFDDGPYAAQIARLKAGGYKFRVSALPGTDIQQIFISGPEGVIVEIQCRG